MEFYTLFFFKDDHGRLHTSVVRCSIHDAALLLQAGGRGLGVHDTYEPKSLLWAVFARLYRKMLSVNGWLHACFFRSSVTVS